jgi:uncharacterized membrane protein YhiD involved in acid resistance
MKRFGVAIGAFLSGVAILALTTYIIVSRSTAPPPNPTPPKESVTIIPTEPQPPPQPPPTIKHDESVIDSALRATGTAGEDESLIVRVARILLKLTLAAVLAAALAFRPHKDLPLMQHNPYVAQTQILIAVVASALMMIVADSAARAFGIFAAASLVRFRTNIRDPKETGVLLASLGLGLATGVGKIEVAIILAAFIIVMLWAMELVEPRQVQRALELTVTTRKVEHTETVLQRIFQRHKLETELRVMDREDEENPLGKIGYSINLHSKFSTDRLSEEIFAADPENVDGVKWDQKKSSSYLYK